MPTLRLSAPCTAPCRGAAGTSGVLAPRTPLASGTASRLVAFAEHQCPGSSPCHRAAARGGGGPGDTPKPQGSASPGQRVFPHRSLEEDHDHAVLHHPRHHLGFQHREHLRLRRPHAALQVAFPPPAPTLPASTCGSSHRRDPKRQPRAPPAEPSSLQPPGRPPTAAPAFPEEQIPPAPLPLSLPPPGERPDIPSFSFWAEGQHPLRKPGWQRAAGGAAFPPRGSVGGSASLGVQGEASPLAPSSSAATSPSCRLFGCATTHTGALFPNKAIPHALLRRFRGVLGTPRRTNRL